MTKMLTPLPTKEVEELKSRTDIVIEQANAVTVVTQEDAEKASDFLVKLKKAVKESEDKRKAFVKPFNDGVKAINNAFKEISEPLKLAQEVIEEKILTWRKEENDRIAKEEARRQGIQKAHEEQGHNVNELIELDRVGNNLGSVHTRKTWTYNVVDMSVIPSEYLTVDHAKVMEAIRNGVRNIDGINIYQEESLVSN